MRGKLSVSAAHPPTATSPDAGSGDVSACRTGAARASGTQAICRDGEKFGFWLNFCGACTLRDR